MLFLFVINLSRNVSPRAIFISVSSFVLFSGSVILALHLGESVPLCLTQRGPPCYYLCANDTQIPSYEFRSRFFITLYCSGEHSWIEIASYPWILGSLVSWRKDSQLGNTYHRLLLNIYAFFSHWLTFS